MSLTEKVAYYDDCCLFHGSIPRVMGNRFDLLITDTPKTHAMSIWNRVKELLEKEEGVFNRFSPDSEVSAVNSVLKAKGKAVLSEELCECIRFSLEYKRRSEGLFDITRNSAFNLSLNGNLLSASAKGCDLDFGGFAKGWTLKKVVELLVSEGVESAFVDFGKSSIYALGHHPAGDCWMVEVTSPFDGYMVDTFKLSNQALSVSGNTPGYMGHIVNPLSGKANALAMMTSTLCSDALDAEVLSTTYMLCDSEEKRCNIKKEFSDAEFKAYCF
ncbi:MAG TPA: FAD:protein FMN transferase [Rikenellaceae bacterium]|nr:FAD:protein FMN transferase [Rikenellaceae bacterium]